jgi:hypothetical protein
MSSPTTDTKARLENFYKKYNPDKLKDIPATLEAYKGRETQLFQALVTKYGPEPVVEDVATKLKAFYSVHNPEKMTDVPRVLELYKGRESQMFTDLYAKYNVNPDGTPTAGSPQVARSLSMSMSPTAAASPTAPTSTSPNEAFKSRLRAYFSKYLQQKLDSVDALAEKYTGREETYVAALVQKYGPEPSPNETSASAMPTSLEISPASPAQASRKDSTAVSGNLARLTAFYEKYQPAKVGSAQATLDKYAGREEELFVALVAKYGPEPSSSSASGDVITSPASPAQASRKDSTAVSGNLARLTAFYEKYQPAKVGSAQATLDKYAGREEELFVALVAKYGPEPSHASSATNADVLSVENRQWTNLGGVHEVLLRSVPEAQRAELLQFAESSNVTIDSVQTVQLLVRLRDAQLELERVKLGPAPASKFSSPRSGQNSVAVASQVQEAMSAAAREESFARNRLLALESDDVGILRSRFSKRGKLLAVQLQFRIIQQGTTTSVMRSAWALWQNFVAKQRALRRKEKSSQMTQYQKLQFTKLAAKYQQRVDREEEIKRRKADAERLANLQERKRRAANVRAIAAQHGNVILRNAEQAKSPKTQQLSAARARSVAKSNGEAPSALRERRREEIQREFDALPLDVRTRLFHRLKKWELLPCNVPPHQRRPRSSEDPDISLSSDQQAAVLDRLRQEQGRADALFNSPIFGDRSDEPLDVSDGPCDRRLYTDSGSDVDSMTAEDDAALAQFLAQHLDE